jgi:hypothetical protein
MSKKRVLAVRKGLKRNIFARELGFGLKGGFFGRKLLRETVSHGGE